MTNNNLNLLQEKIGVKFKDVSILDTALNHRSFLNESGATNSNERLEFLGDAVLELVITEYLYHQRPQDPEGILTAARSAIVRTESLGIVAQNLNLGEFLKMSFGEEKTGGRTNISLLANTTEAIIGALYLDGGLETAKTFVHNHILPLAQTILQGNLKDPKSELQEKVQDLGYQAPTYQTIAESGPDHDKTFTIAVLVEDQKLATGAGKNKQTAQQQAAELALKAAAKLAPKAKI